MSIMWTGTPPGYTHLFAYDPQGGSYSDLGNPRFTITAPGIEQGILWAATGSDL